jgi:hypothetical protein
LLLTNALLCRDLSGQNLTGQLPSSITRLRVLHTMCAHPVRRCYTPAIMVSWLLECNMPHITCGMQRPACKNDNGRRAVLAACSDSVAVAPPGDLLYGHRHYCHRGVIHCALCLEFMTVCVLRERESE